MSEKTFEETMADMTLAVRNLRMMADSAYFSISQKVGQQGVDIQLQMLDEAVLLIEKRFNFPTMIDHIFHMRRSILCIEEYIAAMNLEKASKKKRPAKY